MPILNDLSMSFGQKILFANVNIQLAIKERYGVVGANGSGKSTLLKILAGELAPDGGNVILPKSYNIFKISQDHSLNDDSIIIDTAMEGQKEVFDALKKRDALKNTTDIKNIAAIEETIARLDGYRLKPKAHEILHGLGIDNDLHEKKVKTLSGGFKWRVFLAQALIKAPEILCLDEPTNHLDIHSIVWLENFLKSYHGLVIIVSHDHLFLDRVCTNIIDLDFQSAKLYKGNFSQFNAAKNKSLEHKELENAKKEDKINKLQEFADRFRAKASKASQAQSKLKQIEKISAELSTLPNSSRKIPKFSFNVDKTFTNEVLRTESLSKSFGERQVLSNIAVTAKFGQKIAVLGKNGMGKSTLIKALANEYDDILGKVYWSSNAKVSYFPQDASSLIKQTNMSAIDWLWQYCHGASETYVRSLLGRVLISDDEAFKNVNYFSGGELSRLFLAKIMHEKPNVLLLDEPTNHLDLESIEALTDALKSFMGTLITVSHDRNFIEQTATIIWEIGKNSLQIFYDSFKEYEKKLLIETLPASKVKTANNEQQNSYEINKQLRSQKNILQKKATKIENDIKEFESFLQKTLEKFTDQNIYSATNIEKLKKLNLEKEEIETKIDSAIKEWEIILSELEKLP